MSRRDGYEHGVPSWVAGSHPDPEGAASFYARLFGWEPEDRGEQLVCTLRGYDVAGFSRGDDAAWLTTVWVDSADNAAERALAAGGTVVVPARDLAGLGRSAILADPAGAVFAVSEPDPHRGAQVVNEPGAWAMSALTAPDLEVANAFYGAVFGWRTDSFSAGDLDVTIYRLPGFVGGEPQQPVPRDLVATGFPGDHAAWGVDFWVDDTDATAAKAGELGGRVLAGPFDTPMGRTATLADPQGATFSVSRVVPA